MNTEKCRHALLAKNCDLRSFSIRREDIALEKNAEPLDDIQQSADCVMVLGSLTRNWQMSTLILEALERIDKHTYGLCTECEAQISEKRLAALPWAKCCIRCQEVADSLNIRLKDAA
jgi:DnaK suppressor protein